jgi:hypothetical protein
MAQPFMKSTLVTMAFAALLTGCSSSSGPCQSTLSGFSCGDCVVPGSLTRFCQPHTPTSAQQAACQSACGSSADQAALSAQLSCWNTVTSAAGTCSFGNETGWILDAGLGLLGCVTMDGGQLSQMCIDGFASSFFDGG